MVLCTMRNTPPDTCPAGFSLTLRLWKDPRRYWCLQMTEELLPKELPEAVGCKVDDDVGPTCCFGNLGGHLVELINDGRNEEKCVHRHSTTWRRPTYPHSFKVLLVVRYAILWSDDVIITWERTLCHTPLFCHQGSLRGRWWKHGKLSHFSWSKGGRHSHIVRIRKPTWAFGTVDLSYTCPIPKRCETCTTNQVWPSLQKRSAVPAMSVGQDSFVKNVRVETHPQLTESRAPRRSVVTASVCFFRSRSTSGEKRLMESVVWRMSSTCNDGKWERNFLQTQPGKLTLSRAWAMYCGEFSWAARMMLITLVMGASTESEWILAADWRRIPRWWILWPNIIWLASVDQCGVLIRSYLRSSLRWRRTRRSWKTWGSSC